jgi:hypothetical protein
MNATKESREDSINDPTGTSYLFERLLDCALMLGWNFDEQIVKCAPRVTRGVALPALGGAGVPRGHQA